MAIIFSHSVSKCALAAAAIAVFINPANAQDANTYGLSAEVPVFESVDQNGVDLASGSFRVTSPTYVSGSDEAKSVVGLQWTGKAWTHIERPTLWRNDSKYIVNYMGTSQEFKSRSENYAEKKPITGAKLGCVVWMPQKLTSFCIYTHRNGDVLLFRGLPTPYVYAPPNYGQSVLALGNLGMDAVILYSVDQRYRVWTSNESGGFLTDGTYYKTNRPLPPFTINTPNHNNDTDEHYLRPKNTTQTFTDVAGTQWKYTFNDNRLMTKVDLPGNAADVIITYNDGKVSTVTNPNGTWNYSYSSNNNIRTTTVSDPLGNVTKVKSHTEKGYVTEHTDPLNRTTVYVYDSGDRLERVTFPELNSVFFVYDARGNITSKTTYPKPGSNLLPITETAEYPATCTNAVTCNLPISTTDSLLRKTDLAYFPTSQQTRYVHGASGETFTFDFGTAKPKTVTSPAPISGGARPQVRNEYWGGVLILSAYCRTLASCSGTTDEVVTTYDYGDTSKSTAYPDGATHSTTRLLYGVSVTSEGQTLTTCYDYDVNGRRVSETPPRADVSVCPKTVAPNSGATYPAIAEPSAAPVFPTP